MPDMSRRGFVTVVGGGAVASGAAVGALVVGRGNAPPVTTRGRGRWTSFGTVAVVGASRQVLTASDGPLHDDAAHNDAAGYPPEGAAQVDARHSTWSDTVRVDVEVHNGSDQQVLASPGQFRLRAGGTGPSVTPYDAGWSVGPLGPSETVASWISYLAPPGVLDLWLEYAEPEASSPQVFVIRPEVAS